MEIGEHTFAVGVLDALRMYASWISCLAEIVALKCRRICDNRCFEAEEGFRNEDMEYRRDMIAMIKRERNYGRRAEGKRREVVEETEVDVNTQESG
jgi:hypothetical protein